MYFQHSNIAMLLNSKEETDLWRPFSENRSPRACDNNTNISYHNASMMYGLADRDIYARNIPSSS